MRTTRRKAAAGPSGCIAPSLRDMSWAIPPSLQAICQQTARLILFMQAVTSFPDSMIPPTDAEADPQHEDENQAKDELQKARKEIAKLKCLIERSQVEEGSAWLLRAEAARKNGDHLNALMLAGRAVGYKGYGREVVEEPNFNKTFPLLLGSEMHDSIAEKARHKELSKVAEFIDEAKMTCLPLWAGTASGSVASMAYSPDGTLLICGCRNKSVQLWDTATGKELACLNGHNAPVNSVAFSPDGTRFASGSLDGMIKVWDTATRKELITLRGHTNRVSSIAFSPDSSRLASCAYGDNVTIWDCATGDVHTILQSHHFRRTSVTFRPDGSRFACGTWDNTIIEHCDLTSVAFSPDGSRLACGSWDDTIKLWDTATGEELPPLCGHGEVVNCVSFSPDGVFLASGSGVAARGKDVTVRLWDIATGKELACFKCGYLGVRSIAFSPDGATLAAAGDADTLRLWDVASAKEIAWFGIGSVGTTSVVYSPGGSRLAVAADGCTVRLFDMTTTEPIAPTRHVSRAIFSPDGTRLAGCTGGNMRIWDAATGRELADVHVQETPFHRVLFSPNGSLLVSDGTVIKLWDATTGRELQSFNAHRGFVHDIGFSPDSRLLASNCRFSTKIWDTSNGEEVCSLEERQGEHCCVFSPDSSLLATDAGESIKVRETTTFRELFSLGGQKGRVESIVFSSDSCLLACLSSGNIRLWDVRTGRELFSFNEPAGYISCIVFSPNGSRLIVSFWDWAEVRNLESVIVWDTATGDELTATPADQVAAQQRIDARDQELSPDRKYRANHDDNRIFMVPHPKPALDLTAPLRARLLALPSREIEFPKIKRTTPMLRIRQDKLAQLADPKFTPEQRAELRMELCTKSSQFRAATALWQRLLQGEWPGFEGATVPKDQAPATIPADSPIRRLYLLALIDATKHPQIHGHPTICQTAAQISPVLTKEMMATPTISLAMMSLMQTLAKDENAAMNEPRAALMKKLEEVATKEWLAVLREAK